MAGSDEGSSLGVRSGKGHQVMLENTDFVLICFKMEATGGLWQSSGTTWLCFSSSALSAVLKIVWKGVKGKEMQWCS